MPNRLARETSPYLLQHADNPVDWFPWGDEALRIAREQDRPIFLSIGYSACHWCHVMAHESFENEAIAALLNANFVCVKVDREERPDLDHVYMSAIHLLGRHGGWPLSVFLTPQLEAFYGGTYWPPVASRGMPGFDQVARAVADAYRQRRGAIQEQAAELTRHLRRAARAESKGGAPRPELIDRAELGLERNYDAVYGGFGEAPKFPHPMDLSLLLRVWRRKRRPELLRMVEHTLDKMARGGIYDHLGGGFARYSVDERWLVPHFEKMLYDNALLAGVYVEAFQATGDPRHAAVARQTFDYVLRDLTDAAGGFHSTEDADSEGEEGKFYVWSRAEVWELLGPADAEVFCHVYDVTDEGNFEGHNILNLPKTIPQCAALRNTPPAELEASLAAARAKLFAARAKRPRPGKDDKVLVAWNGLMIDALARGADALNEPRYLEAARRAALFLLTALRQPDGRLWHSWRLGQAKFNAYLDDYTHLVNALVSLYEATFEPRWLAEAARLADIVLARFADAEQGGFYYTADDHEALLTRHKDFQDGSSPSGNALAALGLLRLAKLTGRRDFDAAATRCLEWAAGWMEQAPGGLGQMLIAADFALHASPELALLGDPDRALAREGRRMFLPHCTWAGEASASPGAGNETGVGKDASAADARRLAPLLAGKTALGNEPTLYICQNHACQTPIRGAAAIRDALRALADNK